MKFKNNFGTFELPDEEIGDTWQFEGMVLGKGDIRLVLMFPGENPTKTAHYFHPSIEEWQHLIKQSDDPVTPVGDVLVRKSTYQLDQSVVWACYYRDNYTCVYCGAKGVKLTYDHFLAQKYGGKTTIENGRTSCRPCNKRKGHMTIEEWKKYAEANGLNDGEVL